MPGERELLAAILADPDDDAARLVYADWLLERGDRRGEYIGLMVRAAQHPWWHPGRVTLEQLAGRVFFGTRRPHRGPAQHVWYERGLVSRMAGPIAPLLASPDELEQVPVTRLEVWGAKPGDLTRLGQLPVARRLRALHVHPCHGDELAAFLEGPGRGVRAVQLSQPSAFDARRLAAALMALPALDELGVSETTTAQWAPLAEAGVLRRVTSLRIGFQIEDATTLAASAGAISTLRLESPGSLVPVPSLAGVRELTVGMWSEALSAMPWPLERLDVAFFPGDWPSWPAVLRPLQRLRLRLRSDGLPAQQAGLADAVGASLRALTFDGRGSVELLLGLARRATSLPDLVSVTIQHVRLSDAQARIFAEAPFAMLRRLSLRSSSVEKGAGLEALDRRFGPL